MRQSNDPKDHGALYCGDIDYDANLITGQCSDAFYDKEKPCPEFIDRVKFGDPTYCPKCGRELVYRSWYSW